MGNYSNAHRRSPLRYIKLKAFIARAERQHGLDGLDLITRDILPAIAYSNAMNRRINMSTLLRRVIYGTLPTLHLRVKKLEADGWIERVEDPDDQRSLLLRVTPKAHCAFDRMSKIIDDEYKSLVRSQLN